MFFLTLKSVLYRYFQVLIRPLFKIATQTQGYSWSPNTEPESINSTAVLTSDVITKRHYADAMFQEVNLSRCGSAGKHERCYRFMSFKSKVLKATRHGELEPYFSLRVAGFNVEMGGVFSLLLRLVLNEPLISTRWTVMTRQSVAGVVKTVNCIPVKNQDENAK